MEVTYCPPLTNRASNLHLYRIKKFPGELETLLRCEIELSVTTNEKPWIKPPISMEFQVNPSSCPTQSPNSTSTGSYVHSFRS